MTAGARKMAVHRGYFHDAVCVNLASGTVNIMEASLRWTSKVAFAFRSVSHCNLDFFCFSQMPGADEFEMKDLFTAQAVVSFIFAL